LVEISGHRGYKAREIENSKAAFLRAIEEKLDYVEVDVRATSDDVLVLFHDKNIHRLFNKKGSINKFAFNEIKKFQYEDGQQIFTLQEFMELIKGKIKAILDIKASGFASEIIDLIKNYKLENDVIIQSISGSILKEFYKIETNLDYCIYRHYLGKEFIPHRIFTPIFYKRLIKKHPVKFVSLDGPFMYDKFMELVQEDNLKVILGAMKTKKYLNKLNDWNVDIINANNPHEIKELLNNL
jgi:glycerophosphoryl diester phosphodiesterase